MHLAVRPRPLESLRRDNVISPHGSETLNPRLIEDAGQRNALLQEAESLPALLLSSAAAANAVMLGGPVPSP